MHIKLKPLNRRTFLRCGAGGLGTAIALPALQVMFGSDSAYAAEGGGQPRFLAIYQPNGHQANTFNPAANGLRDLNFDGCNLAPLAPHMDGITIFRNFQSTAASSGGNHHLTAITSWLTGKPVPNDQAVSHSISVDRFIADYYEEHAPTGKSQHEAIEGSHFYDPANPGTSYNNEQKNWLSTDKNGNKIPTQMDLSAALDRMFDGFDEDLSAEQKEATRLLKKSRIDYVMDDIHRLEDRLGAADRQILDSYLDRIRSLEQNLAQPVPDGAACEVPTSDGLFQYANRWGDNVSNSNGHNFIDLHWRDAMQLFAIGFQCEAIRSVAYMLETEAGESGYAEGPNGEPSLGNHHGLSHNPGGAGYGHRDRRMAQVFADMVQLFKDTPVGDGNLLDHSVAVWGAGIGVNHSKDRVMAVVAGHAGSGSINHGALRDMGNDSQIPLMRTLLLHMGIIDENESFGDAGPGDEIDMTS